MRTHVPPAELFFNLPAREQADIYRIAADSLGKRADILEKDVWICWALEAVFSMPGRYPMAFRGGTSLSRVYSAIDRFSEDVDLSIDYRALSGDPDPLACDLSRSALKRLGKQLKTALRDHVVDVIVPHLNQRFADEVTAADVRIDVDPSGEQCRLHYPSVLDGAGGYVAQSVLLEFGGRNAIEPHGDHVIQPILGPAFPELVFPSATVCVLALARTFWEKVTLIHVACQRDTIASGAERQSRHWYDLARLADHPLGEAAMLDRSLLGEVVKHKKAFYHAANANYDACLTGGLTLVPPGDSLSVLAGDYQQMIDAGMFDREVPNFDAVVARLSTLEAAINASSETGCLTK